jgi:cytochrome b561
MLGLISVGYYMVNWEVWSLYPIHKALGVIALLLVLPRAIYRTKKGFLPADDNASEALNKVIHYAHCSLLIGTLLMPISGMLYSGFGGYGIDVFGLTLVPNNYTENGAVPFNETIFVVAKTVHSYIAYALTALIVLHVLGAMKRHIFDKDVTLLRMLGRA